MTSISNIDNIRDFKVFLEKATPITSSAGGHRYSIEGVEVSYNELHKKFQELAAKPNVDKTLVARAHQNLARLHPLSPDLVNTLLDNFEKNDPELALKFVQLDETIRDSAKATGKLEHIKEAAKEAVARKRWEKETGLTFDPRFSLEEHKHMYAAVNINFPGLINALGGLKAAYDIPYLVLPREAKSYIDFLRPADLPAPLMRGIDEHNRPYIVFRVQSVDRRNREVFDEESKDGKVEVLHPRYSNEPDNWTGAGQSKEVSMGMSPLRRQGPDAEIVIEKLSRLAKGEVVGYLKMKWNSDVSTHPPEGTRILSNNYYESLPTTRIGTQLWRPPVEQ